MVEIESSTGKTPREREENESSRSGRDARVVLPSGNGEPNSSRVRGRLAELKMSP